MVHFLTLLVLVPALLLAKMFVEMVPVDWYKRKPKPTEGGGPVVLYSSSSPDKSAPSFHRPKE